MEYRLGSIFDEACDVLVIPSSTGGTVTPEIQQEIRNAKLPFPEAMTRGDVILLHSENPRYRAVAYAAAVTGQTSSEAIVEEIGIKLGWIARFQSYKKFSAPVLGAGSGDLPHPVAAAALARGFQSAAPESAELWISIRDKEKLKPVAARLSGLVPPEAATVNSAHTPDPRSPGSPDTRRKNKASVTAVRQHVEKHIARAAVPLQPVVETPPAPVASRRQGVFISYSHADAEWLERLQKHLKPLQREGVEVWDDTRLRPGEPWREEIREALAEAKVAVLLISADFLASDFIVTDELPPLLKAAAEDGATILPVIVSPCRFKRMESLSRFQAVNDPDKPLAKLRHANREEALDQVAQAVEDALKR